MTLHLSKQGTGHALVFFHGWGFDSRIWLSLVPVLAPYYQVILVDLPGFGQSPMMDWQQFKEHLLQQLPEQFSLVGWSMGGLYATRLAVEESHRLRHLINIASSPHFLLEDAWPGISPQVFADFYYKLRHNTQNTLNAFIALQGGKEHMGLASVFYASPEGLQHGMEVLRQWDFRKLLKTITFPVAYMFGRLDPIVPVQTMKTMQELYPDFHYVFFKRAAHMPFLSHQELFINEIIGFIK